VCLNPAFQRVVLDPAGRIAGLTFPFCTSSLPSQIFHLPALASLDLSGNRFTTLPAQSFSLTAPVNLVLDSNLFTSLPVPVSWQYPATQP